MAYTTPTADEFQVRFPEFGTVPDTLITAIIAEAEPLVGVTWFDADRRPAVMYLTAHLLSGQGYPLATDGTPIGTVGHMVRRKVGDVEVQYGGGSSSGGGGTSGIPSQYASSWYGIQFWQIARRNFPAVAVV